MTLLELFMAYTEPLKGSRRHLRWGLLTIVSAALERRVWLDRGRMNPIFPNMYTILVGQSSMGKSFAADQAHDILTRLTYRVDSKQIKIGPTKITQAALYKELHEAERELWLPGKSVPFKQSPVFIYARELAINLVDFGGGTLTNELIEFYDSKDHDAIIEKRIVMEGKITRLYNPSLTILGCTTQGFLRDAAKLQLITSGLSSRIIFCVELDRVYKQHKYVEQDEKLRAELNKELLLIFDMRGKMKFDAEAQIYYEQISETADQHGFEAHSEFLQNYYGRKPYHLCKLAMVFAAMHHRYIITKSDLIQAHEELEAIEPDMPKAFSLRSIEKDDAAPNYILELIPTAPEGITKANLLSALIRSGLFMPLNGSFDATMKSLKESGDVSISTIGTTGDTVYSRLK